jgi:hypothetical protein
VVKSRFDVDSQNGVYVGGQEGRARMFRIADYPDNTQPKAPVAAVIEPGVDNRRFNEARYCVTNTSFRFGQWDRLP